MTVELIPVGEDAQDLQPGDFILAHRQGLVSRMIRWGEYLRFRPGAHWSHAAFVETPTMLIEALTIGVTRTPLSAYRHVEYGVVRTHLGEYDQAQAAAFARSCLGQRYGWFDILRIALRVLTPGHSLDSTKICSGLVAQALCRGWANYPVDPSSISPAELEQYYEA